MLSLIRRADVRAARTSCAYLSEAAHRERSYHRYSEPPRATPSVCCRSSSNALEVSVPRSAIAESDASQSRYATLSRTPFVSVSSGPSTSCARLRRHSRWCTQLGDEGAARARRGRSTVTPLPRLGRDCYGCRADSFASRSASLPRDKVAYSRHADWSRKAALSPASRRR